MPGTTNVSPISSSSDQDQILFLLREIVETQKVHTSMLRRMLDAATKPIDGNSPVAVALEALVASTNSQTDTMKALTTTMQNLPGQISTVMRAEVDRALYDG